MSVVLHGSKKTRVVHKTSATQHNGKLLMLEVLSGYDTFGLCAGVLKTSSIPMDNCCYGNVNEQMHTREQ
jgi:hypothetical protein